MSNHIDSDCECLWDWDAAGEVRVRVCADHLLDLLAEERERCAQIAENQPEPEPGADGMPAYIWWHCRTPRGATKVIRAAIRVTKRRIAAAIREETTPT